AGEIEVALARHEGVREAVVALRQDTAGNARLIAWVALVPQRAPSPEELRDFLKQSLPDYAVPSSFVSIEAIPLTAHGKVDHRPLPAPDHRAVSSESGPAAPHTPVEEVLAGIWQDLLGIGRIDVRTSFFALGGHSLLATRLLSRIREAFAVEVSLIDVFES